MADTARIYRLVAKDCKKSAGWRGWDRPLAFFDAQSALPTQSFLRPAATYLRHHLPIKRRLADLEVSPQTATPNGDGINDEIVFSFDLLQIKGEVPLSLEVYDLSGRLRRVIYEGQQ